MRKAACATILCMCLTLLVGTPFGCADSVDFSMEKSTPVGSWQERESIVTDSSGKKTVNRSKMSLVGEETRNGEACMWFEIKGTQSDMRGKQKTMIVKMLLSKKAFGKKAEDFMSHLTDYAKELIVQGEGETAMRMSLQGNPMVKSMLQNMNLSNKSDLTALGAETVTTKAGTFKCKKYSAKSTSEINMFGHVMKSSSISQMWISEKIPFGIVKGITETRSSRGKSKTVETLIAYGKSGAKSEITGAIKDMPPIPAGIPGGFGQ